MVADPAADRNTLEAAARHPTRLVHIQRTPRSLRSPRRAKSRRIHRNLHILHSQHNLYTRNRRTLCTRHRHSHHHIRLWRVEYWDGMLRCLLCRRQDPLRLQPL